MTFDLNHDEDQRRILDAVFVLLSANFPIERLRRGESDDLAPLASFGAFAMALPEESGGGFTLVEEALVHTLFGRHLVSTRALATAVAAAVARELGHRDLAADLAAGRFEACVAIAAGEEMLLVDAGGAASAILVDGRRIAFFDLGGAQRTPAKGLGDSVPITRVRRESAGLIAETDAPRLLNHGDLLISAQLLGVAEAARDRAVEYAKMRQQFGRPIGSFQAIKHRCADMAIAAEMLSAQLDMAAIALRDGRGDAGFQIAAFRRLAPRAALGNARAAIQIHGGIGFSAEADAHHYLKHAHVLSRLGGGAGAPDAPSPMAPLVLWRERN